MKNETEKCACQGSTLMRFVQPIILSLLSQCADHGYDLVQKIGQTSLWQQALPDPAGVYRVLRDMEKRGLVQSYLDAESIAGIGKRVFSITEEGRACMHNWLHTLRDYRDGVSDVIGRLESQLDEAPAEQGQGGTGCCCCK